MATHSGTFCCGLAALGNLSITAWQTSAVLAQPVQNRRCQHFVTEREKGQALHLMIGVPRGCSRLHTVALGCTRLHSFGAPLGGLLTGLHVDGWAGNAQLV